MARTIVPSRRYRSGVSDRRSEKLFSSVAGSDWLSRGDDLSRPARWESPHRHAGYIIGTSGIFMLGAASFTAVALIILFVGISLD